MLMPEKDENLKTESKNHPVISHFGDKPIHPKNEKKVAQTQGAKQAKLSDPDFAGKKAIKRKSVAKSQNKANTKVNAGKTTSKTDTKFSSKAKPVILEKTEVKPVEKSTKTVEKPVENVVEKSDEPVKPRSTDEPVKKPAKKRFFSKPRRHTMPAMCRLYTSDDADD